MANGKRDYAYEALAEVTSTDMNAGRGELNAALKSIREQSEIADSYLLSAEIHERAKMYRHLMPDVLCTPSALAKHWKRVHEETRPRARFANPKPLPSSRREQNLEEARKLMSTLWGSRDSGD